MKSITTCPSCQTQFLVTDEQLSQYNGKVRCGHCLNVFNAVDHITVPATEIEADDVETEDIASEVTKPADSENDVTQEVNINSDIEKVEERLSSHQIQGLTVHGLQDHQHNDIEYTISSNELLDFVSPAETSTHEKQNAKLELTADPINSSDVLNELFAQTELPLDEIRESFAEFSDITTQNTDQSQPEIDAIGYQEQVSKINEFDYKPEYQYFLEQKKSTSPVLLSLGLLFILVAFMQCVFFYRHTIAMEFPKSKPYMVSICQYLGCKINLPKEIQLFSIDDSTIAEDSEHQGVIRLTSTITNRADFNQAYPNLEVTLTDTQDKPKLRRIFKPNEYLAKEFRLDEGIASGDSIEIDMPLMADDFKPAGFRLLVSY